jgi:hypothetical protein
LRWQKLTCFASQENQPMMVVPGTDHEGGSSSYWLRLCALLKYVKFK